MFSALTFNIQNGQNWNEARPDDPAINLEATIAFLQSQDADIVFLQEVEKGYEGGKQEEPPPNYEILRKALPAYDSVFGYPLPNPVEIPFGLGLAIFSKTPLSNFFRFNLPPANVDFEFAGKPRKPSHRLLIGADTTVEGRPLRLLNTHLQAFFMINTTSNEHHVQRDLVVEELQRENRPTLLGGDFNCAPGEDVVAQFEKEGYRASQNTDITWRRMPMVLDHIFFNAGLRLERCTVIPTVASDHHAVRSEFSFIA